MWKGTLLPGERVEYVEGQGFRTYTAQGAERYHTTTGSILSSNENVVILSGDVVNNNVIANTLENVGNLSFSVTNGSTYFFMAHIAYSAAATTTGSRWTINGPAVTKLNYFSEYTLAATTRTTNSLSAIQSPSGANTTSLTTGNTAIVWGFIQPSEDGTVQMQFASEITNSAITALAGSTLRWRLIS